MPGRTETKKIAFRCHHADCANEPPTAVFVQVPRDGTSSGKQRTITRHCRRNHANILTVPAEWDRRHGYLDVNPPDPAVPADEDAAIIAHLADGTPVVQGRRD